MTISYCTSTMPLPHGSMRPGAIRMARLRDHRQRGFRCYSIEVSAADIGSLVAHGFLDRLRRDDPGAVERAIGRLRSALTRHTTGGLHQPRNTRASDNNKQGEVEGDRNTIYAGIRRGGLPANGRGHIIEGSLP